MGQVTLVAHRGVPARAPENSASGFALALDEGAVAIELDVRPTADGLLLVFHDEELDRLTEARGPVSARPASELLSLHFTDRPDEPLLLLDEALALIAGRARLDIEVKPDRAAGPDELVRRVAEALERAGNPADILITSESADILAAAHRRLPEVARGFVYRSAETRDPVRVAGATGASVLVANEIRIDEPLVRSAHAAGLELWAYTVNDTGRASELAALGCDALISDDFARLRPPSAQIGRAAAPDGDSVLVLDLGSTRTKAGLVDAAGHLWARADAATPVSRPAPGVVEHDASACLDLVRSLIGDLAAREPVRPVAAALASQRSTGLWARGADLAPCGAAPSWRDGRGDDVVARLEPRRAELERLAGLPLVSAWTAIKGRHALGARAPDEDEILLPLASWIAARLTESTPHVDPTLANRMFLLRAGGEAWSDELLDTFGLSAANLPHLTPTVASHGEIAWPGGGRVPLRVLVGDQQAAYAGATRSVPGALVLNLGTAAFAMRAVGRDDDRRGRRRAPLPTSASQPIPTAYLLEVPVLDEALRDDAAEIGGTARRFARELALGAEGPHRQIRRLADAVTDLAGAGSPDVVLCGGLGQSPHVSHLLTRALPLRVHRTPEPELTMLGAAALARAARR